MAIGGKIGGEAVGLPQDKELLEKNLAKLPDNIEEYVKEVIATYEKLDVKVLGNLIVILPVKRKTTKGGLITTPSPEEELRQMQLNYHYIIDFDKEGMRASDIKVGDRILLLAQPSKFPLPVSLKEANAKLDVELYAINMMDIGAVTNGI